MNLRVVVMDYQNVHLTAHGLFMPHREKWEALISPMSFARAAVDRRNAKQRPGFPKGELAEVYAFRGLPNSAYDPAQHRRATVQAQQCPPLPLRDLTRILDDDTASPPAEPQHHRHRRRTSPPRPRGHCRNLGSKESYVARPRQAAVPQTSAHHPDSTPTTLTASDTIPQRSNCSLATGFHGSTPAL